MIVVSTSDALRESLDEWRHSGDHIALVPTMGNLHDGYKRAFDLTVLLPKVCAIQN